MGRWCSCRSPPGEQLPEDRRLALRVVKLKDVVGSHAAALRAQGASQELADAVGTDNFEGVKVDPKDRALLK